MSMVTGYKATHNDMTCRGYQFELGKTHTIEGHIEMCRNGFHMCRDLVDVFKYYRPFEHDGNIRVFKVIGSGIFLHHGEKTVCQSIQFTEEVTIEQLMTEYSDNNHVRVLSAYKKYMLDTLVTDPISLIRTIVAKQGYGLEHLVKDHNLCVRVEVAKHGYGLDVLINDDNWCVRVEVARQGYGLDVLINDADSRVRFLVKHMEQAHE